MPLVLAKCTQCGAIVKVDKNQDAAVCEFCGTPFIIEKAINNYNINIEKATIGPSLETLYKLARRAKDDNNADEAAKYYDQILLEDPDSWEATFFSRYFKICNYSISNIIPYANSINQSIETPLTLAKGLSDEGERLMAIAQITEYTNNLLSSMYDSSKNFLFSHKSATNAYMEYAQRSVACITALVSFGNIEYRLFKDNPDVAKICIVAKSKALVMLKELNDIAGQGQRSMYDGMICPLVKDCSDMIKQFDPDFIPPQILYKPVQEQTYSTTSNTTTYSSSNSSSNGCYVATCVYGSYDCPEVWTLRRYRDTILRNTWYGRLFIKMYYSISPTVVRILGKMNWFHKLLKPRLDRFVEKLRMQGFSDSPYVD